MSIAAENSAQIHIATSTGIINTSDASKPPRSNTVSKAIITKVNSCFGLIFSAIKPAIEAHKKLAKCDEASECAC